VPGEALQVRDQSRQVKAAAAIARLDDRGELVERHPPADLVVGRRHAARQAVMRADDLGATVRIAQA
jgi:hypothetical protein